jgi:putative transposase
MDGSIVLSFAQRKTLLEVYRRGTDPQVRLRAHALLLLADRRPWALIVAVLFTSTSTISRWRKRFLQGGCDAVLETARSPGRRWQALLIAIVLRWVTCFGPTDFGFVRSRWTCETVALLLREERGVRVSRETVRRWLHQEGLVWRRPRPVLGPKDPQHASKLRKIRHLLAALPADETAVFEDEVDINTNPKIGSMWMRKGQQAEVVTPGNNVKRYLAGSLSWRTGELILSEPGMRRNADLFLTHLDDLRRRYRRYRVIHVICDNAAFHHPQRCRKVREYLEKWGHRIVLHFLPTYAPQTNPIERVWWHLHEEITRNHRCPDIDSLLEMVFDWLDAGSCFEIETSIYDQKKAA